MASNLIGHELSEYSARVPNPAEPNWAEALEGLDRLALLQVPDLIRPDKPGGALEELDRLALLQGSDVARPR